MTNFTRRSILSLSSVAAGALAGCGGLENQGENSSGNTAGRSPQDGSGESGDGTQSPQQDGPGEINSRLDVSVNAGVIIAARESDSKGLVNVGISVENRHEQEERFAPVVEVGGTQIDVTVDRGTPEGPAEDSSPPVDIPPTERPVSFSGWQVVSAGQQYDITLNGTQVDVANLQLRDTVYRLGTPGRTKPRMPAIGIGTGRLAEPTLVTQFSYGRPERISDIDQLQRGRIRAITEDRIYLNFRWMRSDGGMVESLAALDRWSGERAWHLPSVPPSEIAVVDGVEYILTATSRETMDLVAQAVGGSNQWRTELSLPVQEVDGTNLVPAGENLYVSTADGVAEIARQSGDIRRTLPGVFGMVGEDAVYTFGGEGPLSKFPLDGSTTTPAWQQTPGDGTGKRGAVADGTVYVSSYDSADDIEDHRIELSAYDAADGSNQWSIVASEASTTAVGAIPPGLGDLYVRQGHVMAPSNQGLTVVETESGREMGGPLGERNDRALSPLHPLRIYGVGREQFYVTDLARGSASFPRPETPLPEPLSRDNGFASMLYGQGVMYVVTSNGVYGYSASLPDSGSA